MNIMTHFINSISSYDTNIMLAAVISLLVVILFVLLLHIYAKWFLAQSPATIRSSSSTHSHGLPVPSTFNQHFYSYPEKGLHPSAISSIPLFVYSKESQHHHHQEQHGGAGGLQCVICLSFFEENETGRRLIKCGHGFHVECIDMWLHSHTNCPICRAPVMAVVNDGIANSDAKITSMEQEGHHDQVAASIEIIHRPEGSIHRFEGENDTHVITVNHDPASPSSSSPCSSSFSSALGSSLKRMLSRSTSRSDSNKVSPSNNHNDSQLGV